MKTTKTADYGVFAPVRLARHQFNGVNTSVFDVIVTDEQETDQLIHTVSDNYRLVTNEQANEVASLTMAETGYTWDMNFECWDGKRWVAFYRSKEALIELPTVGDAVNLGLRLENSYDGTRAFSMSIMMSILTCTNGMVSDKRLGSFRIPHKNGDWEISTAASEIMLGAQNVMALAPALTALTTAKISKDTFVELGAEPAFGVGFLGGLLKKTAEEKPKTMWDLCQMGTAQMTDALRNNGTLGTIGQLERWTDHFLEKGLLAS